MNEIAKMLGLGIAALVLSWVLISCVSGDWSLAA